MMSRRSRIQPVDYRAHIDGFCRYWQNLRYLKFAAANWRCEGCGDKTELQCHHRHYDSVGYEEPEDLMALCPRCHAKVHTRERLRA
jgi:5-methylcytosine-specific restriction endonuclease McrA